MFEYPQVTLSSLQITFQTEGCAAAQGWGMHCGCRGNAFWDEIGFIMRFSKTRQEQDEALSALCAHVSALGACLIHVGVCIRRDVACTCALCTSAYWECVSSLLVGPRDVELSSCASPRLSDKIFL